MANQIMLIQRRVEEQFDRVQDQLVEGKTKQDEIITAADSLVTSLQTALTALNISQQKHETAIGQNESQLQALLKRNEEIANKNLELEKLSREQLQALYIQDERQRALGQQSELLKQHQWSQSNQLNVHGQTASRIQQEMAELRVKNRERTHEPSQSSTTTENHGKEPAPIEQQVFPPPLVFGPKETIHSQPSGNSNANHVYAAANTTNDQAGNAPTSHATPSLFSPYGFTSNAPLGFTPNPCAGFPNMIVDPCPTFTPSTFQNWKREIKLWIAGQPGATATQLLAKLIHAMPLSVKSESLIYMEQTERDPNSRSISHVMDLMDTRYGRTDSERACAWLSAFTDFKRETQENYKDFWTRFTRCVAKLGALGMPMNQTVVPNRAIQALRLPYGQLPIVLSALETRPDRFSVDSLREITIRMYEAHKPGGDSSEVFATSTPTSLNPNHTYYDEENDWDENEWWSHEGEWDPDHSEDVSEIILDGGSIMLMKPKKQTNPRNTPGIHESSRQCAVRNFSFIPNRKGKGGGKSVCLRCGDPSHHWEDCPHPFREKLDPRFSSRPKGKGKGKSTYTLAESPPEINPNERADTPNDSNPAEDSPAVVTEPATVAPSLVSAPQPSINDIWAQYYSQNDPSLPALINVCHTIHLHHNWSADTYPASINNRCNVSAPPPILIDSGASCSAVGEKWIESWGEGSHCPVCDT